MIWGCLIVATKKKRCSKNKRYMVKEHKSQLREVPIGHIWDNVNIKPNNESKCITVRILESVLIQVNEQVECHEKWGAYLVLFCTCIHALQS